MEKMFFASVTSKHTFYKSGMLHGSKVYTLLKSMVKATPASNYMFKVNNRNTRTRCEICSELTVKTPERRFWRRSGVFIVNFEHNSLLVLVFLLLTLSR